MLGLVPAAAVIVMKWKTDRSSLLVKND
jgi:hypothetical protein